MTDEDTAADLVLAAEAKMQTISSSLRDLVNICGQLEDPALLLAVLYGLREVRSELSSSRVPGAYQQIEELVFPVMGEQKLTVVPFGEFVSRRGMNRSGWRYDELVPVLVARALDERVFDPETGEASEREADTVARVLLECLSLSGAKVTGLRARGLTPAEFCVETPKAWSLTLPRKVTDDELGLQGPDEAAA